jgi:hypothetical protein
MRNLKGRIEKLEKHTDSQTITAVAEDGAPFRLRRDNLLPLACAAMRRRSAEIEGLDKPVSRFDSLLDHLQRSGVASTAEPMLEVAADILRKDREAGNE